MFQRQKGQGLISWLVLLSLFGYIFLLVLKIVPMYVENYQVKHFLLTFNSHPIIQPISSPSQLESIVIQRMTKLYVNDIKEKDISVSQLDDHSYSVVLDYNIVKSLPLMPDISLVKHIYIDETVSVSTQ